MALDPKWAAISANFGGGGSGNVAQAGSMFNAAMGNIQDVLDRKSVNATAEQARKLRGVTDVDELEEAYMSTGGDNWANQDELNQLYTGQKQYLEQQAAQATKTEFDQNMRTNTFDANEAQRKVSNKLSQAQFERSMFESNRAHNLAVQKYQNTIAQQQAAAKLAASKNAKNNPQLQQQANTLLAGLAESNPESIIEGKALPARNVAELQGELSNVRNMLEVKNDKVGNARLKQYYKTQETADTQRAITTVDNYLMGSMGLDEAGLSEFKQTNAALYNTVSENYVGSTVGAYYSPILDAISDADSSQNYDPSSKYTSSSSIDKSMRGGVSAGSHSSSERNLSDLSRQFERFSEVSGLSTPNTITILGNVPPVDGVLNIYNNHQVASVLDAAAKQDSGNPEIANLIQSGADYFRDNEMTPKQSASSLDKFTSLLEDAKLNAAKSEDTAAAIQQANTAGNVAAMGKLAEEAKANSEEHSKIQQRIKSTLD